MTLVIAGTARCRGCDCPVYVTRDGASGREIARDGHPFAPEGRHVCADPDRRERIELTVANLRTVCRDCGATAVAWTSWGRLVEFPAAIWASALWDEPYEPHVCLVRRGANRNNTGTVQTLVQTGRKQANQAGADGYRVWGRDGG